MATRWAVLVLGGLYPALYFLGGNWFAFRAEQNGALLAAVVLACLAAAAALSAAAALGRLRTRGRAPGSWRVADGCCAALALALGPLLLRHAEGGALVWTVLAVLVAGGAWVALRGGLELIAVVLVMLTLIIGGRWIFSYVEVTRRLADGAWYDVHRDFNQDIELVSRPDVYFIIAESYPSRVALKEIYDFDNTPFCNELESMGFAISYGAFSNYLSTLTSLSSLFAMEHHFGNIALGRLDAYGARDLIGGRVYNAVVDVFRRNGYAIQYVHEHDYQLRRGAAVDFYWPRDSRWAALESFLTGSGDPRLLAPLSATENKEFQRVARHRIEVAARSRRPWFTYLYVNAPGHSSNTVADLPESEAQAELAQFRRREDRRVRRANGSLRRLLHQIVQEDPDAVVVVAGDHGAWGYRTGLDGDGEPAGARVISLDRLGILLAVRMPPKHGAIPADARPRSPVNLFRHIFTALSRDPAILATAAPDHGFSDLESPRLGIRDGIFLDDFELR